MGVDATAFEEREPMYPVRLSMLYPERLSRLSTAFRPLLFLPIAFFLNFLGGGLVGALWAAILVRGRIPRWLFDFNVGYQRFTNRAVAYGFLLTDRYPPFEGAWDLQYEVDYPDRLSRWQVFLWKVITLLPHFVVLFFLYIAAAVCVIIAWFAILITGAFPRGLHRFVVGVLRWSARVTGYFSSLTDTFPPFSLDEDAGPGSTSAHTVSAVIGVLVFAGGVAIAVIVGVVVAIWWNEEKANDVALGDVLAGNVPASAASIELDDVRFTLRSADDPAELELLSAPPGKRIVLVTVDYASEAEPRRRGDKIEAHRVGRETVRLETDGDSSIDPVLLTFNSVAAPVNVPKSASGTIDAVFEVDFDDEITEIRAYPNDATGRHVAWELR